MAEKSEILFDVSTNDPIRQEQCQREWGVTMSESEKTYLKDQQSARKMVCDKGDDPVLVFIKFKENEVARTIF